MRQGSPKPDISSVDALKRSLLDARMISMPESTSGQFLKNVGVPKIGIADKVSLKIVPRGIDFLQRCWHPVGLIWLLVLSASW